MTNPFENENQQTITPEETRQSILAELDASKQAITELSDEQLEEVAGGIGFGSIGKLFRRSGSNAGEAAAGAGGTVAKSSFKDNIKSGVAQGLGFLGISALIGQ